MKHVNSGVTRMFRGHAGEVMNWQGKKECSSSFSFHYVCTQAMYRSPVGAVDSMGLPAFCLHPPPPPGEGSYNSSAPE
jgi:hypothetical protein